MPNDAPPITPPFSPPAPPKNPPEPPPGTPTLLHQQPEPLPVDPLTVTSDRGASLPPTNPPSPRFGLTLSSEEHAPSRLVAMGRQAEDAGFHFVSVSDHFHPWTGAQGHSPFVWSVLGALAVTTNSLDLAVGVSCPTIRIHPAIVAQAAATTSLLADGRFTLGVGTGEALNEHIFGDRWPPPEIRRSQLREAVEVIRSLWSGDTVDHHGPHYTVENARLFDPPEVNPPIVVSGFGDDAVDLAAEIGDGYWGHTPDAGVVTRFHDRGGRGPRFAQVNVCVGPEEEACRKVVERVWPLGGIPGQLHQDLPTWSHFEMAAEMVTTDQATENIPCGPNLEAVAERVETFVGAGYDHVYLHQIGPDQGALFNAWHSGLRDLLLSAAR